MLDIRHVRCTLGIVLLFGSQSDGVGALCESCYRQRSVVCVIAGRRSKARTMIVGTTKSLFWSRPQNLEILQYVLESDLVGESRLPSVSKKPVRSKTTWFFSQVVVEQLRMRGRKVVP